MDDVTVLGKLRRLEERNCLQSLGKDVGKAQGYSRTPNLGAVGARDTARSEGWVSMYQLTFAVITNSHVEITSKGPGTGWPSSPMRLLSPVAWGLLIHISPHRLEWGEA